MFIFLIIYGFFVKETNESSNIVKSISIWRYPDLNLIECNEKFVKMYTDSRIGMNDLNLKENLLSSESIEHLNETLPFLSKNYVSSITVTQKWLTQSGEHINVSTKLSLEFDCCNNPKKVIMISQNLFENQSTNETTQVTQQNIIPSISAFEYKVPPAIIPKSSNILPPIQSAHFPRLDVKEMNFHPSYYPHTPAFSFPPLSTKF